MSSIDKRIVEMDFDNKRFESGVQTSIRSLDALKKGLNLENSVKGLDSLSKIAAGFNLSSMAEGINHLSNRFSTLGIIGMSVIHNLTTAAMGFAKKITDTLIVDPLKTGLNEYETQINAVQTILANTQSKGTTIDQVNSSLDELNTYADKTIYNFSEMARNIGTFTAAGVDLDKSTQAIKGIANLAAVSGSNSQQASTAMYQLSQALASGTVRLMDWNSVQNAGMGGEIFRNSLIETAKVHGIKIDEIIKKQGSFRESLSEGWLTSEIMLETLAKFTGDLTEEQLKSMGYSEEQIKGIIQLGETASDAATKVKTLTQLGDTLKEAMQSGWAQSWRIVIGDFEEARTLFTEISDTLGGFIEASSKSRNELLQGWKDYGGRVALIQALRNTFEGLLSIMKPIQEAFAEIFPPMTAEKLFVLTAGLVKLTEGFKIGEETASKLKRTFKGVAAVFDIALQVVSSLVDALFSLGGAMAPSAAGILDFTAKIGDYLVNLRDGLDVSKVFNDAIAKIGEVLATVKGRLSEFLRVGGETFKSIKSWFSDIFDDIDMSGIKTFTDKMHIRFEPLTKLVEFVGKIISGIGKALEKVSPTLFKFGKFVWNMVGDLSRAIADGLLNLNFNGIFDAVNSGLLAALLLSIRKFMTQGTGAIGDLTGGITDILDGVKGSLEAWQSALKATTLLQIAAAIAILAAALVAISMVDSEKLTVALTAVTVMFGQLITSMSMFSKIPGGGPAGLAATMIALSLALLVMAGAVSKLAKLEPEELVQGLLAIQALSLALVSFSKTMSANSGNILKSALGLIVFGVALNIMVSAIKSLGDIDSEKLSRGLVGVGVLLAELAIFLKSTDLGGMSISKSIGILILAAALNVLAIAVKKLGELDPEEMTKGLTAIGVLLAELAIFTKLTGNSKNVITTALGLAILGGAMLILAEALSRLGQLSWTEIAKGLVAMGGALLVIIGAVRLMPKNIAVTAISLVAISGALFILSHALKNMGSMSWEEIARGLTALAGSMAILALGVNAMSGAIGGAIAMMILAAALTLFVPMLKQLSSMSIQEIGTGLLALAGTFVVLGLAGLVLAPLIPTLLGLSAAMLLFGLATAAVGVGVLAFSAGLAALAVSGTAGAAALVLIISTILGLIPMIVVTLVSAIGTFAALIVEVAPVIMQAFTAILLGLIGVIATVTPPLLAALTVLLLALIATIITVVPPFVEAVLYLVDTMLAALAAKAPSIIQSGFDLLIALLKGIRDNLPEVVTTTIEIVTEFLDAVASKLDDIIESGINLAISFIDGITDGIEKNTPRIIKSLTSLGGAIVDALVEAVKGGTVAVTGAIADLANAALNELKKVLGIKSPSKEFWALGKFAIQGLVAGLEQFGRNVKTVSHEVGEKAIDGLTEAAAYINQSFTDDLDMNPTIRPVVDLTDVTNSRKQLDKLLSTNGLNLNSTIDRVANIKTGSKIVDTEAANSKPTNNTSIEFTQNNYSPKALSRFEIYRQTRNQLRELKGVV